MFGRVERMGEEPLVNSCTTHRSKEEGTELGLVRDS